MRAATAIGVAVVAMGACALDTGSAMAGEPAKPCQSLNEELRSESNIDPRDERSLLARASGMPGV